MFNVLSAKVEREGFTSVGTAKLRHCLNELPVSECEPNKNFSQQQCESELRHCFHRLAVGAEQLT